MVDYLLDQGYENISVLDISANALARAKKRLGEKAEKVTWIEDNITVFEPKEKYDIWHDRAVFHSLTTVDDIKAHQRLVAQAVNKYMIIGTFSINGLIKCSGLEIKQNDESSLVNTFGKKFNKIECFTENHTTPFYTTQNFIFCTFAKK
ncbi:class I SAM-dependent methyltransferase [Faecalibacter macacae]|uniref:class I SAM-dependent methyltransferase n=1 Tax=Faecalibacter macacae TaxID=1859289 RepID=UPI0026961486|nr:class I SAM-dependent methyltransferase [Faecalibacter macacae]